MDPPYHHPHMVVRRHTALPPLGYRLLPLGVGQLHPCHLLRPLLPCSVVARVVVLRCPPCRVSFPPSRPWSRRSPLRRGLHVPVQRFPVLGEPPGSVPVNNVTLLPHLLDLLLQLLVKAGLPIAHPGLGHLSVCCLE